LLYLTYLRYLVDMAKKEENKVVKFAQAPYADELVRDEDFKAKFNEKAPWQRQLIKRLIDTGDLKTAARDADVDKHVGQLIDYRRADDKSLDEAITDRGITPDFVAEKLFEILTVEVVRFDNKGVAYQAPDHALRLKVIEFIAKVRGELIPGTATGKGKKDRHSVSDLFPTEIKD